MTYYLIKLIISSFLILLISELAKKNSFAGSLFASIPLISIIAFFWLYVDTKDISKIIDLSYGIFWLVIPSLGLFLILPQLLKYGLNFYVSMFIASLLTMILYWLMIFFLNWLEIKN